MYKKLIFLGRHFGDGEKERTQADQSILGTPTEKCQFSSLKLEQC